MGSQTCCRWTWTGVLGVTSAWSNMEEREKGHVRLDFETPNVEVLNGPDLKDISTAQDHSTVSTRPKLTFTPVNPSPVANTVIPQLPQNLARALSANPDLPKSAACQPDGCGSPGGPWSWRQRHNGRAFLHP